nr:hypothetical protein [Tanacetum cinerariifolium]
MKTKRKLVPKSTAATISAGSGECNVVGHEGYDNVCGVGPSVPTKKQCIRESGLVSCRAQELQVGANVSPGSHHLRQWSSVTYHDQGLQVSGLLDVGLSVPTKRRCVRQSASESCGDQWFPTSGMPHAISNLLLLFVVITFELLVFVRDCLHVSIFNMPSIILTLNRW